MADGPILNQFNLVVTDMAATVAFYRRLGLTIPDTHPDWATHLTASLECLLDGLLSGRVEQRNAEYKLFHLADAAHRDHLRGGVAVVNAPPHGSPTLLGTIQAENNLVHGVTSVIDLMDLLSYHDMYWPRSGVALERREGITARG
jgi:catechol 2,3-dioxygenase-like lactoylglutathione lyase family enzyme